MIYNVEILRISPNFMDFFYPRFQDSAYVYTPLALKNEDFSSNLTIPLSNFGLSQIIDITEKIKVKTCGFLFFYLFFRLVMPKSSEPRKAIRTKNSVLFNITT